MQKCVILIFSDKTVQGKGYLHVFPNVSINNLLRLAVKEHITIKMEQDAFPLSFFWISVLFILLFVKPFEDRTSVLPPVPFHFKQLHHHSWSPSTEFPQNPGLQKLHVGELTILSIKFWEDAQKCSSHKGVQQQTICPHSPHQHQKHT